MAADLDAIRRLVRRELRAELIVTVSPVPLVATMTPFDVQVGNTESKTRIRAAVSELLDRHEDVHYFHSYEMVTTAERSSDFMKEDGRHLHRHAVDFILSDFLRVFAGEGVDVPKLDTAWLTKPTQTASPAEMEDKARSPKVTATQTSVRADALALARKASRRLLERLR